MIKNIKYIIPLVVILGFSSCNLDRFPKDAIAANQSLESVDDANNWDSGFLAAFRFSMYGRYCINQDIQSDILNATSSYGNNYGYLYSWSSLNSSNSNVAGVWSRLYARVKNPNLFLANIAKVPIKSQDDKDMVDICTADALVLRSYLYSMLAIRYGTRYNSSTASTDLCVPLILEFDVNKDKPRATNKEVYSQILSDLDRAAVLYENIKNPTTKSTYQGAPNSMVVTLDAVKALKARVLLYMQDWNAAYSVSTDLIASGRYPLVDPDEDNFVNMWRYDNSSEDIFTCFISKPDELPNGNGYFSANVSVNPNNNQEKIANCTPNYLPTQGIIDLFEDTDLRKPVYFDSSVNTIFSGTLYPAGQVTVISKFKGNPDYANSTNDPYWNGYVPNGVQAPKVFRIAETYLIAAEAAFNLNDEVNARKYLNELRVSRGLTAVASTGNALRDDIRAERTRELAFEGFRLWDIRRWGLPLKRMPHQELSDGTFAFLASIALDLDIPNDSPYFVWGIPSNDIQTNPKIEGQQNPGW